MVAKLIFNLKKISYGCQEIRTDNQGIQIKYLDDLILNLVGNTID